MVVVFFCVPESDNTEQTGSLQQILLLWNLVDMHLVPSSMIINSSVDGVSALSSISSENQCSTIILADTFVIPMEE